MPAELLKLDLPELKSLKAKVKSDAIYADPWHSALDEAVVMAAGAVRGAAPSGKTGDLAASVTSKLSAKATVMTARVVVTAKHGKLNYPRLIEFAAKYHHRGFAIGAVRSMSGAIEGILQKAARAIETAWSS